MASTGNKVLSTMLDRLLSGLMSGPGMNCRPHASRQRVDLTQLGKLGDLLPEDIFRRLLGPDRQARVLAKIKAPRKQERTIDDESSGESLSPEQRAWEDQASLLNKLRLVADDARTYEQDTGVHVLNLGFPILTLPPGSFSAGNSSSSRRILAPIAFIPVTLTLKRGVTPAVELVCRGEGVDLVQPNTALLAWLEQQTGIAWPAEAFSDSNGEDPWREISELVQHAAAVMHITAPPEFAAPPAPAEGAEIEPWAIRQTLHISPAPRGDDESDSPAILLSAVLGLFPMANHGLLRDTQAMLAESGDPAAPPLSGPIETFLSADVDFDEPLTTPCAPQPLPEIPRRSFAIERLAAAADPCQGRAVALARESRALVIHGPPGTGKSQTITNIIVDHLARGQRVLLVCDKRTALDVVANRLQHMNLGRFCGIVHDPQRDQRDLYKSIRQQLDDLPELTTRSSAESELTKVDGELEKLHAELIKYHHSLMSPKDGQPSLHELMGQWMKIRPQGEVKLDEQSLTAISPAQLDNHEPALLELLRRSESIDFSRNAWAKCIGISLETFLVRPMDSIRTALNRCLVAAESADATIDPAIPPLSTKSPLPQQGQARVALADRLEHLLANINPSTLQRWVGQDAAAVRAARQKLREAQPSVSLLSTPLAVDLRGAIEEFPKISQITQQLASLQAYLNVAGKWYTWLSFGVKSEAAKVNKIYGLLLNVSDANRVYNFLLGLRARLIVQQLRSEFGQAGDPGPDDVLQRFAAQHEELFEILLALAEDPSLDGLAPAAHRAMSGVNLSATLIDGLRKSGPRADALARLEEALGAAELFKAEWLEAFGAKLRHGEAAAGAVTVLIDRLDQLEDVLRVVHGSAALPPTFHEIAGQLLQQNCDPAAALATVHKAVRAGEIRRRLRDDPQLQKTDARAVESRFERYRLLDAQKKQLVRDAVEHRWVARQKERLLATTGSRLNSAGAELRRRLMIRGQRALRLRQVIAAGEKIDGGDPLFDLCPIWMASPQTVAQVFARKPVFDLVVFDEASQCRLEEALPVLTRGQRVVIAGDPQQLPPTRFFESAFAQSENDEPETDQELFETQQSQVEDLLGAALNLAIQQCYLDVHYRSRNSDLIEFSNANFYSSRLQAIPAHPRNRTKFPPITLYQTDGIYENRRNEIEANAVVKIVHDLLRRAEPPSIGIACFNLQQRDLIVEKLDELCGQDADFGRKLAESRARQGEGSFQGLFVKNLENVQGDERDHIIISTTYGPDPRGKFYRRFGPLGRAGGGRRLNVLVTRARHEVHLVSSIPRGAYQNLPAVPDDQVPGGAWLLFAYLKYAQDLAAVYESFAASDEPAIGRPATVNIHASKSPSLFCQELASDLAKSAGAGSDVHWGNEGFCVDLALHHPLQSDDVTIGVLCDSCRYAAADDPVEWDIFRTAILAGQGWKLRRIWTPHFFRDPSGNINGILKDAAAFIAAEPRESPLGESAAEPPQAPPPPIDEVSDRP